MPQDPEFLGEFLTINSPANLANLPESFRFTEDFFIPLTGNSVGTLITSDITVGKVEVGEHFLSINVGGGIIYLPFSTLQFPFEVVQN